MRVRDRSELRFSAPFQRWFAVVALYALALLLRVPDLDKSVWIDEAGSLAQATAPSFTETARAYDHPPLYFALLRAGTWFTDSIPLLRLLSVASGLALVAVSSTLRPSGVGLFAGLLVALSPEFAGNSQELRQYALLSACIAVTLRLSMANTVASKLRLLAVGVASVAVVATHLIGAFFIAAMATVQFVRCRDSWYRRLGILLPYVPAAGVAWLLKSVFLQQTDKAPSEWWVGSLSWSHISTAFSSITGWSSLRWLAAAVGRHISGAEPVLLFFFVSASVYLFWRLTRQGGRETWALLSVAVAYWALVIGYSMVAVNLVLPRLLLPGMIPLLWAIGLTCAKPQQFARINTAAILAVLLAVCAAVQWSWQTAWRPREDLRGLAAKLEHSCGPNTMVVLSAGLDFGVKLYWPGYNAVNPLILDLHAAPGNQLTEAYTTRGHPSNVLLVYRWDAYQQAHPTLLRAVRNTLQQSASDSAILWDKDYYFIERYTMSAQLSNSSFANDVMSSSVAHPARF
ncbi:hypothetical protein [Opitutus terrae]|uniref:Glycosyltransferase RgtA/B/C/D-like domain-containing protein n=1 Tax=Opitutus terrae (strain DSM 11246 / JCM 15787 / PB90-1) TaxID=452637 RepID=B1ZW45_OPITP|nr:hypothetical protein [Opitutus terrae]ACB76059.1 hypothetical protein Oter_2778 [Opitutus terrae PB90-1]